MKKVLCFLLCCVSVSLFAGQEELTSQQKTVVGIELMNQQQTTVDLESQMPQQLPNIEQVIAGVKVEKVTSTEIVLHLQTTQEITNLNHEVEYLRREQRLAEYRQCGNVTIATVLGCAGGALLTFVITGIVVMAVVR